MKTPHNYSGVTYVRSCNRWVFGPWMQVWKLFCQQRKDGISDTFVNISSIRHLESLPSVNKQTSPTSLSVDWGPGNGWQNLNFAIVKNRSWPVFVVSQYKVLLICRFLCTMTTTILQKLVIWNMSGLVQNMFQSYVQRSGVRNITYTLGVWIKTVPTS